MRIGKKQAVMWRTLYARDLYERGIAVEQIAVEMGVESECTVRAWLRAARASKVKHTAARLARKAA